MKAKITKKLLLKTAQEFAGITLPESENIPKELWGTSVKFDAVDENGVAYKRTFGLLYENFIESVRRRMRKIVNDISPFYTEFNYDGTELIKRYPHFEFPVGMFRLLTKENIDKAIKEGSTMAYPESLISPEVLQEYTKERKELEEEEVEIEFEPIDYNKLGDFKSPCNYAWDDGPQISKFFENY